MFARQLSTLSGTACDAVLVGWKKQPVCRQRNSVQYLAYTTPLPIFEFDWKGETLQKIFVQGAVDFPQEPAPGERRTIRYDAEADEVCYRSPGNPLWACVLVLLLGLGLAAVGIFYLLSES